MTRFILGTCHTIKNSRVTTVNMEARIASLLFSQLKDGENNAQNCETLHCCTEERQRFSRYATGVRNECRW